VADLTPCDYAVEATDYERLCVWREWHAPVQWEDEHEGRLCTIGELDGRPIAVCVSWSRVEGRRVAFYHASSQLVDHVVVERWVRSKLLKPGGTHSDAMNFHIVMQAIQGANGRRL
jgi:hypothetical protein